MSLENLKVIHVLALVLRRNMQRSSLSNHVTQTIPLIAADVEFYFSETHIKIVLFVQYDNKNCDGKED